MIQRYQALGQIDPEFVAASTSFDDNYETVDIALPDPGLIPW